MKTLGIILALAVGGFSLSAVAEPIFPNSVVSNDLDFITTSDTSAYTCLNFKERIRAELPDKRHDGLFVDEVYTFHAGYTDGTAIEIWVHPDIGTQTQAAQLAVQVAHPVGKLPTFMREKLHHVGIHQGDETAFAESEGNFFMLYSENIQTRINDHDLEETIFHEAVHATLEHTHERSNSWREAQKADNDYITEYARHRTEDMAESALFAWAVLVTPGRLPKDIEQKVQEIMPNRLKFFENIFLKQPVFQKIAETQC